MEITQTTIDGFAALKLAGEIDLAASPTLRSELQTQLQTKCPALILDFSEVDYIDSSGLATLIEFVRDAGQYGGKLALFGLKPKVKMVFDLVRLNELFTIVSSSEEASAALR